MVGANPRPVEVDEANLARSGKYLHNRSQYDTDDDKNLANWMVWNERDEGDNEMNLICFGEDHDELKWVIYVCSGPGCVPFFSHIQ